MDPSLAVPNCCGQRSSGLTAAGKARPVARNRCPCCRSRNMRSLHGIRRGHAIGPHLLAHSSHMPAVFGQGQGYEHRTGQGGQESGYVRRKNPSRRRRGRRTDRQQKNVYSGRIVADAPINTQTHLTRMQRFSAGVHQRCALQIINEGIVTRHALGPARTNASIACLNLLRPSLSCVVAPHYSRVPSLNFSYCSSTLRILRAPRGVFRPVTYMSFESPPPSTS